VRPETVSHVLYHARCDDGYGAAFAAWQVLGDNATYLPVSHGDPPPTLPRDSRVAMVDFSYLRPVIEKMHSEVEDLVVLDHHRTAEGELRGLPYAHFDMDKSGAHLAWEYWHPGQPFPDFLAYIEDKDLWRFKLPESKEFTAALRSYPMDFKTWSGLTVERLRLEGRSLLRLQDQLVDAACERARWGQILEHKVPIVNATEFRSEVVNRLCERYPEAPFAAAYYDNEKGERAWSLRSLEFDVSEVARQLGGGGHKNSSGFVERDRPNPPPQG